MRRVGQHHDTCAGSNVKYGPILFAPKCHDYSSLQKAFGSCPPGMDFYGVDVYGENGVDGGLRQLDNFIHLAGNIPGGSSYPHLLVAETNTSLPESCSFSATANGVFTAGTSLDNGLPVMLSGEVPEGFEAGLTYFVIDSGSAGSGSFQLSDTSFGAAIEIQSSAMGTITTVPAPRSGDVGTGWFMSVCARMHDYGTNSIGVLTFWNVGGALSGGFDPTDQATINSFKNCTDNIFDPNNTTGFSNRLPVCTSFPCMPA